MNEAIMNPFIDPTATAVASSRYFGGWGSATVEFDGGAAKLGVFVIRSRVVGHDSPPKLR